MRSALEEAKAALVKISAVEKIGTAVDFAGFLAAELPAEVGEMVDRQAGKRVALEFRELRRTSWDHCKLGGVY